MLSATDGYVTQRTVVGYSEAKTKRQAGCRLCCKFFDITSVGEAALKSHAKGAKLVEFVKLTANAQANTSTMRNLTDTP